MGADMYEKAVNEAKGHEYLYHYTNKKVLDAILKNCSLRLSRLDVVNDPLESKRIKSLWSDKLFVVCFANDLGNEAHMLSLYGDYRITFKAKDFLSVEIFADEVCGKKLIEIDRSDMDHKSYNDEDFSNDWGVYNVSTIDVQYVDDIRVYDHENDTVNPGLLKNKQGIDIHGEEQTWENEHETRIRVAVRPKGFEYNIKEERYYKPSFKHLYISLKDKIVCIEKYDQKQEAWIQL